jgi:hypothetical protein
VGFALGIAGLMQPGKNTNTATAGLSLNFFAAGAVLLFFLLQ